jgi:hypothetical protein
MDSFVGIDLDVIGISILRIQQELDSPPEEREANIGREADAAD